MQSMSPRSRAASGAPSGVSSFRKAGSALLTGDITLSEGANVTLTQVGQDIKITSSGGGAGGNSYFPGGWL
jgi:hypothetical protein